MSFESDVENQKPDFITIQGDQQILFNFVFPWWPTAGRGQFDDSSITMKVVDMDILQTASWPYLEPLSRTESTFCIFSVHVRMWLNHFSNTLFDHA